MPRKITRLVALTAAAFLVGGIAAAASSDLLSGSSHGNNEPVSASKETTTTGANVTTTTKARGPNANGPAKFGLCNAYFKGKGVKNGGKANSTAFKALAAAAASSPGATDAARIKAFCAGVMPGNGNGEAQSANNGEPSEPHGNNETGKNHKP